MKKYITQVGAILLLASFVVGCVHSRATYNTLAGLNIAATESVLGYYSMVAKKQVSSAGVPMVAKSFDNFQVVWTSAVALAQFNTNAIASPVVTDAANNVAAAIIQAKGIK